MKRILLLGALLSCSMFGCGAGAGGSSSSLESVYLTSSPVTDRLEADILTGNSCTTGGGSYATETVGITVSSTAYPNTITPSPVTIQQISISYSPYTDVAKTHPIPVQYDTGGTILPGSTTTFNVKVAPDNLKYYLVNTSGFQTCSADYWEYYAVITFSGIENFSKKSVSFTQTVKVAFADRNNI